MHAYASNPSDHLELLQVMFTPAGNSHAPQYKQGIPIKITHNNKGPVITCTAASFMLKAAFDPPSLDLGAILPQFDGQQPNQALLKLINPSDVDMEVSPVTFMSATLLSWSLAQVVPRAGATSFNLTEIIPTSSIPSAQHYMIITAL